MNYITYPELRNIGVLINFINSYQTKDTWFVGVDITVHDQNGEPLGVITLTDGGEYGFFPTQEN